MAAEHDDQPPQYTRYRASPRLLRRRERISLAPGRTAGELAPAWRRRLTPNRIALGVLALLVGWLALSLLLFLISSHFERTSPPADVAAALDSASFPLTSANNILVLGSDRRQKSSKEPHANTSGPSRSDTIMLLRIGGGHAARLSIPRDTLVEIPGHGRQKINAAYAIGGAALSISVSKSYLSVPINHLVEVNFEDLPQLVDAMGGVDYTGGCVVARINGGFRNGGYTLRLAKGTHHLDGRAAAAPARPGEMPALRSWPRPCRRRPASWRARLSRGPSPWTRRPCPPRACRVRRRWRSPAWIPRPPRRSRARACACRSRCCRSPCP